MFDGDSQAPRFSVVVPFHDEQQTVRELYERLAAVMSGRYEPTEFIFVDDHSTDATSTILSELAEQDPRVLVIRLKRNYGQTAALAAGFDYASGEIIISMDGDLQHDPEDIPAMLAALQEHDCDLVSGWRKNRVDNWLMRRLPSRVANWLMAQLSGVDIHDFGTTFKVYRRDTIKDIRLYGELHRFIPALASWYGAKVVEVPIRNVTRPLGQSHYGISRTLRVISDLITIRFLLRYMTRPLHFFGPASLGCLLGGTAIMLFLFFEKLAYGANLFQQHGPLMVLGMILGLSGLQLLAIGLLGELLMRTFFEAHQKPVYRVERILGGSRLTGTPS